jgi:hypothetical protein
MTSPAAVFLRAVRDAPGLPCGADPDRHFPEGPEGIAEAKQVCAACPSRSPCLEYALATDARFGIWAGVDFEASGHGAVPPSPLCDNGHWRTAANTRVRNDGRLECTECEAGRRGKCRETEEVA